MTEMTRDIRKMVDAWEFPDFEVTGTLGELLKWVQSQIDAFGADAEFDIDTGYGSADFEIRYRRPETDKEFEARLKKNEQARQRREKEKERQRKRDLAELARLKSIHEGECDE